MTNSRQITTVILIIVFLALMPAAALAEPGGVVSGLRLWLDDVTVTARGVCWSTSANPTTADSNTTDGTRTGVFTSNITGLIGRTRKGGA